MVRQPTIDLVILTILLIILYSFTTTIMPALPLQQSCQRLKVFFIVRTKLFTNISIIYIDKLDEIEMTFSIKILVQGPILWNFYSRNLQMFVIS